MKISAKIEYACLAVMELAARYSSGEPAPIRTIAETHQIPQQFLVQILLQLKGAGIVSSTRGASGGYRLARDPSQITLAEVMACVDGANATEFEADAQSSAAAALRRAWKDAAQAQLETLESFTFADLLESAAHPPELMYYI